MNAGYVANGDNLHEPYQTAFHEFGHNIDWLAGHDAGGYDGWISKDYENGKLEKTIKSDWGQFKLSMFRQNPRAYLYTVDDSPEELERAFRVAIRHMDTGDGKYAELSHRLRGGEVTLDSVMADDKIMNKLLSHMGKSSADNVTISLLKREDMSVSERGNISDAIEFCTRKSYPLGVGHGSSYWKTPGAGAQEFFAETLDGKVANPKALAQMRRVFPNAVGVVEEMVGGLVK